MKLLRSLFTTALIVLPVIAFAQTAPDTLWTRTYRGDSDDTASQVIQTSDGGYAIAGVTASFGVSGNDVYLIRTNADGDTIYTRTYGGIGYQGARSIVETPDHGFLIDGDTDQFPGGVTGPYLIRTNASGDTLWTRTYGNPQSGWLSSACAAHGGGYVLCGQLNGYSHVVKIDESGNTVWARYYGGGGHAWQVKPASDGGYVVTGQAGYPDLAPESCTTLLIRDWYIRDGGLDPWQTLSTRQNRLYRC